MYTDDRLLAVQNNEMLNVNPQNEDDNLIKNIKVILTPRGTHNLEFPINNPVLDTPDHAFSYL